MSATGASRRPKGLIVLDPGAYDRIYGEPERAQLAELLDLLAPPMSARELASHHELLEQVEVIVSGWGAPKMDGAFLARAPKLRLVCYGAGAVRGFVSEELFARGITVTSANALNAIPVAEYSVATILFSLKRGFALMRSPLAPTSAARDAVPGAFGSRVGLAGLGTIGRLVARRLAGFDLELVAYDPYCPPEDAGDLGVRLVGLDELFASSHVVSLHLPLYAATRHIVTAELLESMRENSTLINSARGGLVDHLALANILARRDDLQAVLDVTDPEPLSVDHPLLALDNVVITPHIAGSLGPECRRLGQSAVEELGRYLAGQPLLHRVDPATLAIAAIA